MDGNNFGKSKLKPKPSSKIGDTRECEEEQGAYMQVPEQIVELQESTVGTTDDAFADEILHNIIQSRGNDMLLFIKERECPRSQQVLSILQGLSNLNSIEVFDASEITSFVRNFDQALLRLTGNEPPVAFYKYMYAGNYLDVMNLKRFGRLDLLLEPPLCPYYHIIVVGSGHGARSTITGIAECFELGLKVAFIEITSFSPQEYGSRPKCRMPRTLIWNAIRILRDKVVDPCEYWNNVTLENLREREDVTLEMQCEAANIDYFRGTVQFLSTDLISVSPSYEDDTNSSDCGGSENQTKNILGMSYVICTGTEPKITEFPGSEYCIGLESFLYGGEIPLNALIIGNTPEVFETAYLIALSGGEVTVMTESKRWLSRYDQRFVKEVLKSFRDLSVTFINIAEIIFVKKLKFDLKVLARLRSGRKYYTGSFDYVIVDYKRMPIADTMDLEQGDVQVNERSRKILVDKIYRTTNPTVWAFGGVAHGHPSYPKFEILAAKRIINLLITGYDTVTVPELYPNVLVTPLEYVFCGETEKTAKCKSNERIVINDSENFFFRIKLICIRRKRQYSKTDCRKEEDQVIGVHIIGHNICTMIFGLETMIEKGVTKDKLVEQLVTHDIFKDLGLNRISFTSHKLRKGAPYTSGDARKNCYETDSRQDLNRDTFKDLELNRISFTSQKLRNGSPYTSGDARKNCYETDSDTSSIFIKTWSRTSVQFLEKVNKHRDMTVQQYNTRKQEYDVRRMDQKYALYIKDQIPAIEEDLRRSLISFLWPILLSLLPLSPFRVITERIISCYSSSDEKESILSDEEKPSKVISPTRGYSLRPLRIHRVILSSSSYSDTEDINVNPEGIGQNKRGQFSPRPVENVNMEGRHRRPVFSPAKKDRKRTHTIKGRTRRRSSKECNDSGSEAEDANLSRQSKNGNDLTHSESDSNRLPTERSHSSTNSCKPKTTYQSKTYSGSESDVDYFCPYPDTSRIVASYSDSSIDYSWNKVRLRFDCSSAEGCDTSTSRPKRPKTRRRPIKFSDSESNVSSDVTAHTEKNYADPVTRNEDEEENPEIRRRRKD